jgi:hypothetical protein
MKIDLGKFGEILVSRPAGRDAFLTLEAYQLRDLPIDEIVEVDFSGVKVLTPSWADEVVTPLAGRYKNTRLLNTTNASVKATLQTLKKYSTLSNTLSF